MAEATQDTQVKTGESSGIPEKSPFSGDAMDRYAEQLGLLDDNPSEPAGAKQEALKKTKPCEGCPDEDEGETPSATVSKGTPEKKAPQTPYKILKDKDGTEVPVYSQDELDELAIKGATGLKQSQTEAKADVDRDRLRNAMLQLDRIQSFANGEAPQTADGQPAKEEEIDLDTIDDPALRSYLKRQGNELRELRKVAGVTVQEKKGEVVREIGNVLGEVYK